MSELPTRDMVEDAFTHRERSPLVLRATLDFVSGTYGRPALDGFLEFSFGELNRRFLELLDSATHFAYALEALAFDRLQRYLIEEELQPEPLALRDFTRIGRFCYENRRGRMAELIQPFALRYLRAMTGFVQNSGWVMKCQVNCRKHPTDGYMQLAFLYQFHPGLGRMLHPGSFLVYDGFLKAFLEGTPLRANGHVATKAIRKDLPNPVEVIEDELFVVRPSELQRGYAIQAGAAFLDSDTVVTGGQLGGIYYAGYK